MELVFWLSLFIIFYVYFGYALLLILMDAYRRLFKPEAVQVSSVKAALPNEALPSVTLIITAYNEEQRIARKIENALTQIYPPDRLEILIASDCSNDRTDNIVLGYAPKGVKLVRAPERKGKENAQMHAVRASLGDILVFSDVSTILKSDALQLIVKNFRDPSIGCVSSEDRFIDRQGHLSGEGLYVKYEMYIRTLESRVNTIVGLSGSFFAARREVCRNWMPDLQSDFNTLLNSVKIGLRGVSDPHSIGYYENIVDERKEFQRKVRTVLRGITVLMRNLHLLNPHRYGLFAWQLISHKLCRWLVPLFLIAAFFANVALIGSAPLYLVSFILQSAFYAGAVSYFILLKNQKPQSTATKNNGFKHKLLKVFEQITRIAYYFVAVNSSILFAWLKYFSGQRATFWQPSRR
jgi:glycosyltransferase involved in cell wall biosynthesis